MLSRSPICVLCLVFQVHLNLLETPSLVGVQGCHQLFKAGRKRNVALLPACTTL